MSKDQKMITFLDWLCNSVKSDNLRIVKITDLNTTVLGLQCEKTLEVFVVGGLHDLTFILEGNQ